VIVVGLAERTHFGKVALTGRLPASMRRKSLAIERNPRVVTEIGNLVPGEQLAHLRARHAIDEEPDSGRSPAWLG
jgi:hypothetical protein